MLENFDKKMLNVGSMRDGSISMEWRLFYSENSILYEKGWYSK